MTTFTPMSTLMVLLLFCVQPIFSQTNTPQTSPQPQPQRSCSTMDLHEQKMQSDEAYRQRFYDKIANANNVFNNSHSSVALCPNPVIIPMAVHYQGISTPSAAEMDCLIALAEDQIQILNDDYHGTNSDISTWNTNSVHFPGIENGETCIQFCLANINHPSGYSLNDGDLAVTYNEFNGDNNTDWANYLNIFVRDINFLGYSPFGGDGNGDGVTIDNNAFGSGSGCSGVTPGSPYNLGRTLTHELGHYLLLDHIWGGGCGNDDGVADTPDSQGDYGGCPNIPASSCGSNDLTMNYMDYTNDACMYMFSAGQSTVMENYLASSLSNLTNNASNVCGTVQPSVAFTSSASSFIEGTSNCNNGGMQTITVQMAISSAPSAITFANIIASGTATSGQDFNLSTSSVTFPAGIASTQTINLTITEDAYIEGIENIQLSYTINSNGGDAIEGTTNQTHTITIDDDDYSPYEASVTLLDENFNSGSTGWTITNGGNNSNTWALSSGLNGNTSNSLDGSQFMIMDSRSNGNYDEILTSPSLNSDGMTAITLEFDQYINVRNNGGQAETFSVDVWNGSSWQNVFYSDQTNGDIGSWNSPSQASIDITAHANANMQVRFAYTSGRDRWWAIDNIQVTATSNIEVQTDNNSGAGSADHHLGPFETVHFYDMNTGNIMMTIENTSAHDYGCTTVEVDQPATANPGASRSTAPEAGYITSKNLLVSPEFNNIAGSYRLSLYYTAAEITGWAAASGLPISDLEIVKSRSNVSTATFIELITPTVSDFNGDFIYEGTFNNGFSGFALGSPPVILPVEMLDFSAKAKEKSILLNWTTASETNNKGFEILRSSEDSSDFKSIGWLDGYGNSTRERNYHFEDTQVQRGITYYYQLRQIDFDEKSTNSSIVSEKTLDKDTSINIFPNPAKSVLQVELFAKADGQLRIVDVMGRTIKQDIYKIGEQSFNIDLSNFDRGIYWIVTQEEGLAIQVQKFVKM